MKRMILSDEISEKLVNKLIEMTDERSINWDIDDEVIFKHEDCMFKIFMSEDIEEFEIIELKVNDDRNETDDYNVSITILIPFIGEIIDLIVEKNIEDLQNEINNANLWSNNINIKYNDEEVLLEWDNFTITKIDDDYFVTSNVSLSETNLKNVLNSERYHLFCYQVELFLNGLGEKILGNNIKSLIES
jgi:hypothetical protein